jgi:hypothetical protein
VCGGSVAGGKSMVSGDDGVDVQVKKSRAKYNDQNVILCCFEKSYNFLDLWLRLAGALKGCSRVRLCDSSLRRG